MIPDVIGDKPVNTQVPYRPGHDPASIRRSLELQQMSFNLQMMMDDFDRRMKSFSKQATSFNTSLSFIFNSIGYIGAASSSVAGLKYTQRPFLNSGYWKGVNGKYYSFSILEKGGNGAWMYRNSADIAKNSVKWLGRTGTTLGWLSTGYSAYNFFFKGYKLIDGTEFGVGLASTVFWEVGATYSFGKIIYVTKMSALETLVNNGHGDNPWMWMVW